MLTLITPTGARPAAFSICEKLMARQTYEGPVRWIIVDDGEEPTKINPSLRWSQHTIRPTPFWRAGDNTQARNLTAALDAAERLKAPDEDMRLVIIEDDDWYHPSWLETVAGALDRGELVGASHARYYNVACRRGSDLNNLYHASLRCSALRGRAIAALRRAMKEFSKTYDLKLWRDPAPTKHLFRADITVGMKGLPGRDGIADGHRNMRGRRDPDLSLLRSWVGADADLYADFFDEDAMTDKVKVYATGRLRRYENRALVAGDAFEVAPARARAFERLKFATLEKPERPPAVEKQPLGGKRKGKAPAPDMPPEVKPETPSVAEPLAEE